MKSEQNIKDRIRQLDWLIHMSFKHNVKYIELARRVNNSWKDLFSTRYRRYMNKARELVSLYDTASAHRACLYWVLDGGNNEKT
jgi:hypothetical protein